FAGMLLWGHENGYRNFCRGASPLSGLEQRRLAPVWHRIGHFLFHNGESFYKFAGLRQFKQKFAPNWSPEYLTVANKMDVARVLYEVSVLISKGPQETTRTAKTRHVHSAPDLMTIRSISAE
ncbi:MAG: phosphatidylglycerol lysyltransferase domain-containing protein, partial [Paracoccaceae bacterium]|nr:phosphatidylglycerol lysyltransferase domain-containing protein [Paracoccaceae bacterium]